MPKIQHFRIFCDPPVAIMSFVTYNSIFDVSDRKSGLEVADVQQRITIEVVKIHIPGI